MPQAPFQNYGEAPPPYTIESLNALNSTSSRSYTPYDGGPTNSSANVRPSGSYSSSGTGSLINSSRPDEQSPLLNSSDSVGVYQTMPRSPPHKKRTSSLSIVFVILAASIASILLFCAARGIGWDDIDPVSRERIRKEWSKDVQKHHEFVKHVDAVRAQWVLETQEHDKQRLAMVEERLTWQVEREEQERSLRVLHQAIEQDRHAWEVEKRNRESAWQRRQKEKEEEQERKWRREDEERRKRDEEDRKRRDEEDQRRRDEEDQRRKDEEDRRRRDEEDQRRRDEEDQRRRDEEDRRRRDEGDRRRRDEEDRRKRDEEDRRRRDEEDRRRWAKLGWENLYPSQKCLAYGTREYTAKLADELCREMNIEIHGVMMKPKHCEDKGGTWATWTVDFEEPLCITSWSGLSDKGCIRPGARRYEQHLDDVPWGTDWEQMCTTAPTDIHGRHFDRPTACVNRGLWGMYGYWDVEDPHC